MTETLDVAAFAETCSVKITKPELFNEAMTHRSYLNEHREEGRNHNERLEFLGDAVLELWVTEHLFENFKNPEGELTAFRAALVNGEMLASVGKDLGIEPYLMMSKGEAKDTGRARNYLLANAMEAIIGAVHLDQGYEAAGEFIDRTIITRLAVVLEKKLYVDPKSYFQEKAQEHMGVTPHYEVVSEQGPDHDREFIVGVYIDHEKVAEGTGASKQDAQRNAARAGLEVQKWL